MLVSQQESGPSADFIEAVVASVRDRLYSVHGFPNVSVSFDEYAETSKQGGVRRVTNKQTIVIEIDGGDPDVKIDYNHKCCGQK